MAGHVEQIAQQGGTPLVVAEGGKAVGVIHLKDIVKGRIRERFAQMRQMGIQTVMITGDNTDTNGLCDTGRIYYLADGNMNVTSLVNTSGDALERYIYDPYGRLTIYDATWSNTRSSSSYSNYVLFTGRHLDPETGLYYYRARYYSAELGRFVSRDPIGYQGGINLYEYVGDNLLIRTDPRGTEAGAGNITNEQSDYAISQCRCTCAADNPGLALRVLFGSGRQETINKMYDIQQACNDFATQAIKDLGVANTERNHSALRHCCMSAKIAQLLRAGCAGCLGDAALPRSRMAKRWAICGTSGRH